MTNYSWDYSLNFYRSRFFWQDMLKVFVIPLLVFLIFMDLVFLFEGEGFFYFSRILVINLITFEEDIIYPLIFLGIVIGVSIPVILIVVGTRYNCTYEINSKGIYQFPQKKEYNKGKKIGLALIFAGMFAKSPGAVGTGLITGNSQSREIKWNKIKKIKYYDKINIITLYNPKWLRRIVVYANDDNYETIKKIVNENTKKCQIINTNGKKEVL